MIFPIKSNRACKSEVAFCVPGRFKTSQSGSNQNRHPVAGNL